MRPPRVTIGITAYNRAQDIGRAIASVRQQTYPHVELVVVDDASTDGTVIAAEQALEGEGILIINKTNGGIAAAKNTALRSGSGTLRGLLDSDDWYEPTFVEQCVAELRAHPSVGLVYTDNYLATATGEREIQQAWSWSLEALLRCKLRGDCWLARWSVLKRTPLHDERLKLDLDYDLFFHMAAVTQFRRIPMPLQTVGSDNGRTSDDRQAAAYWHAACLAKHGHDMAWAIERAAQHGHPEWHAAIEAGYAFGLTLR